MDTNTPIRPFFAGLDYHKKSIVIALGDVNGNLLEHAKLPCDEKEVRRYFKDKKGIVCAIENCRGFEWLVDLLPELGVVVKVSNPYATKLIAQSRCKTDKIDSKILMQLLAKDFLPTCYQPSLAERALKERLRWRTQVVRSANRFMNRTIALVDKENKGHSLSFAARRRSEFEKLELLPDRKDLVFKHLAVIDDLKETANDEDKWISKMAKDTPQARLLMTIPGIGEVAAVTLLAELGDINRFRKARNVAAYIGLVPRLYSSANTKRFGPITKGGQSDLRAMLIQNAWMSIRKSMVLKARFTRIAKKRGRKIAIVAIARILAEVAFHVLKSNKPFDERLLAVNKLEALLDVEPSNAGG